MSPSPPFHPSPPVTQPRNPHGSVLPEGAGDLVLMVPGPSPGMFRSLSFNLPPPVVASASLPDPAGPAEQTLLPAGVPRGPEEQRPEPPVAPARVPRGETVSPKLWLSRGGQSPAGVDGVPLSTGFHSP